jgi:hypothetical protein
MPDAAASRWTVKATVALLAAAAGSLGERLVHLEACGALI